MRDFDYSDEFLEHIADIFKAFANLSRLKIIRELHKMGNESNGLSVNQLQDRVGTSQANISKHLNIMEEQGLVKARKEGTKRKYKIAREEVMEICDFVCGHLENRLDDLTSLSETSKR